MRNTHLLHRDFNSDGIVCYMESECVGHNARRAEGILTLNLYVIMCEIGIEGRFYSCVKSLTERERISGVWWRIFCLEYQGTLTTNATTALSTKSLLSEMRKKVKQLIYQLL